MERALNTRKVDVEIVVCRMNFDNGKSSYFCRLLDMNDEFAPGENWKIAESDCRGLDGLATFAVGQLERFLAIKHPLGDWFAIRFPQESIGIANVFGQLLLYQGLSSEEQAEIFGYFANENWFHSQIKFRARASGLPSLVGNSTSLNSDVIFNCV